MASITVTTGATLVIDPADLSNGAGIGVDCQTFIKNNGVNTIYLDSTNTVATTTGFPLDPGESIEMELGQGRPVYALTAAGSSDVRILRV